MGSKRTAVFFGAIALALLSCSGAALYESSRPMVILRPATVPNDQVALIVEPDDGMLPVEQLIESASSSIDVVMYEFEDTQLEHTLAQEAHKGIAVRVILDNGYFGAGSSANQEAYDYFQHNGVQVHWSPTYFALTHEKSIVVDGKEALIMTFNLSPQYYKSDRDLGIRDDDPNDVTAIEQTFNDDWTGHNDPAQNGDDLVWSPNSRDQLLSLIDGATRSLDIYNEEMQDPQIIQALEQAAQRGVDVEVNMTYASEWKPAFQQLSSAGVHVRTLAANAPIYIHAKMIIADGKEAFIGSENFSATSLDQNRELGVIVSDPATIITLSNTFARDWRSASVFLIQ